MLSMLVQSLDGAKQLLTGSAARASPCLRFKVNVLV